MNDASNPDERYFDWLYSLVDDVHYRSPSESYVHILEDLYTTPFTWFIRNDENRAQDGFALRQEYVHLSKDAVDSYWLKQECSIFEMLIALSRRAAFQTDWSPATWFWHILNNLDVVITTDDRYGESESIQTKNALERLNQRNYESNGHGGLFPLRDPERDQREVEIWYQLSLYLFENFDF